MVSAKEDFFKWATGLSGCDGGNLDGKVWFCGIEWGGGFQKEGAELVEELKRQFREESWTERNVPSVKVDNGDDWHNFFKHQYNRKTLKIISGMRGEPVELYKKDPLYRRPDTLPFARKSNFFKLNLYPISFAKTNDELWKEPYYRATGLPTKSLYKGFCQKHRFSEFQRLVKERKPRVIIGTSKRDTDFILAFDGADDLYKENRSEIIEGREIRWRIINDGETILFITPFLGGHNGLNSNKQLEAVGAYIRERADEVFRDEDWLKLPRYQN